MLVIYNTYRHLSLITTPRRLFIYSVSSVSQIIRSDGNESDYLGFDTIVLLIMCRLQQKVIISKEGVIKVGNTKTWEVVTVRSFRNARNSPALYLKWNLLNLTSENSVYCNDRAQFWRKLSSSMTHFASRSPYRNCFLLGVLTIYLTWAFNLNLD